VGGWPPAWPGAAGAQVPAPVRRRWVMIALLGELLLVAVAGVMAVGMPLAYSMVWPTSPGAKACSRCVSCSLDAPAGQRQIAVLAKLSRMG
jgi:hypothetical protein